MLNAGIGATEGSQSSLWLPTLYLQTEIKQEKRQMGHILLSETEIRHYPALIRFVEKIRKQMLWVLT